MKIKYPVKEVVSPTVSIALPPGRMVSKRPPLGPMSIAAMLEKHGISVNIIDLKTTEDEKELLTQIIAAIRANPPRYLGLSCMTPDVAEVKEIAREIKRSHPSIVTVIGGIHATLEPEDFAREDYIDYVCVGHGELTMLELTQVLDQGGDSAKVNGLMFRRDGQFIKTPERDIGRSLDHLPPPAYHLVNMDYYLQPNEWLIRGVPLSGFYMFTSRGCPFSCTFCAARNTDVRYRSPKVIVDDIEYLINTYNIDGLYFYDDTFSIKKSHVMEICREIERRNIKILWACETRANLLTNELLAAMKKAGCIQIDFGIETGSDRLGSQVEKGVTVPEAVEAFRLCKKHGIRTLANWLFNLPGETEEDVEATKKLARKLKANLQIFNILILYPGHPIYEQYKHIVDPADYKAFQNYNSFDEFLELIERKYRLAKHNIKFQNLIRELSKEFLSRKFKFSEINLRLIYSAYLTFEFLLWPKYWTAILRSRKKNEYFFWLCSRLTRTSLKHSV